MAAPTGPSKNAPRTARARARAAVTEEIVEAARRHLADASPADLSLRAVARELGMASSAVYRYFPTRDELLTRLIIDAYDAIGAAVEAADPGPPTPANARFVAIAEAARGWARAHPHEWALVYGSPVAGYRAPEATIGPATRVARRLVELLPTASPRAVEQRDPDPRQLMATTLALRPDVDPALMARGVVSWQAIYGAISFELFGHLHNVVSDYDEWFRSTMRAIAAWVELDAPLTPRRSARTSR